MQDKAFHDGCQFHLLFPKFLFIQNFRLNSLKKQMLSVENFDARHVRPAHRWWIAALIAVQIIGLSVALTLLSVIVWSFIGASENGLPSLTVMGRGIFYLVAGWAIGCLFAILPVSVGMLTAFILLRLWNITSIQPYLLGGIVIGMGWILILTKELSEGPLFLDIATYALLAWGAGAGLIASAFFWRCLWKGRHARKRELTSVFD